MPEKWHQVLTPMSVGARILAPMRTVGQKNDASKRERQLLEALYRLGRATAAEIQAAIPNPPTYTAVRTHLSNLEQKGLVKVETSGQKYVYQPTVPREEMARDVVGEMLSNFFENRVDLLVASLMDHKELQISTQELDKLEELIQKAREAGR